MAGLSAANMAASLRAVVAATDVAAVITRPTPSTAMFVSPFADFADYAAKSSYF